jgi:protein TonB
MGLRVTLIPETTMFTTLIESRRRKERTFGGTAVSVLVHAAVITLGVYVTAHASGQPIEKPNNGGIIYSPIAPAKVQRARPAKRREAAPDGALPKMNKQVLTAPVRINVDIPPIDASSEITNTNDFGGTRTTSGGSSFVGGDGSDDARAYFENQVDKPAIPRDGNAPPRYPSMLERSRVSGEVVAQFVVDTTGRVDVRTLRILRSSDALFSASLKSVLPGWRFLPAEAGGKRVNQIVQLPVRFAVPQHE